MISDDVCNSLSLGEGWGEAIEVGSIHFYGQIVYLHQCISIGIEEITVGLEVYDTVRLEE